MPQMIATAIFGSFKSSSRVRPAGETPPPRHDVIEERMRPVKLAGRLFE